MNHVVHKYRVPHHSEMTPVVTGHVVEWLHAEMVDDVVYAWARILPVDSPAEAHAIAWYMTGEEKVPSDWNHLASFTNTQDGVTFVAHVFTSSAKVRRVVL